MINTTIEAEGFSGRKKVFKVDYWQDLYSALQNGTVLRSMASAMEDHQFEETTVPCLIVFFGPIKGIIPLPKSGFTNRNQLRKMIGQQTAFKVVQIHRDSNRVILDGVQALKKMAKITWKKLKEGQKHEVVVREVHCKAAFVDLEGILVELPAREFSWGFVNNLRDYLRTGDRFEVKITRVDKENKEIQISVRELLTKPWPDCATRYVRDGEYHATVSGIVDYGIFCNLEMGVDALIPHLSIHRHKKIQRKNQTKKHLSIGDQVMIRVISVDLKKEQIRAVIVENI